MSGRIVNIEPSAHQAIQELLPWFVMDQLEGRELDMVREHLAGCAQCRAEADWQRKLRAVEPVAAATPDVGVAWTRMQARLDDLPGERPAHSAHSAPKRASSGNPVAAFIRRLIAGKGTWMPWALAVQFVAIAGLGVMVAHLDGEAAAYRVTGAASFHTLGTPKSASSGNIMVMFRPDASARELQAVLQASGARVVDGPTSAGAWLLNVDDAHLTATVKALRAKRGVALAEPLTAGAAP